MTESKGSFGKFEGGRKERSGLEEEGRREKRQEAVL
jgi:hypothetical protein